MTDKMAICWVRLVKIMIHTYYKVFMLDRGYILHKIVVDMFCYMYRYMSDVSGATLSHKLILLSYKQK